jgi:uncharacterized protein (TIGR00106 family)
VGKAMVAVSITPVGSGSPGVSGYVRAALRVLERAAQAGQVRYAVGPMFTSVEGELALVLGLVQEMQEAVFAAGAQRVSTVLKIDERRDRESRMEDKVRAVAPPGRGEGR